MLEPVHPGQLLNFQNFCKPVVNPLVAWNQLWWENSHYTNWQNQFYFFFPFGKPVVKHLLVFTKMSTAFISFPQWSIPQPFAAATSSSQSFWVGYWKNGWGLTAKCWTDSAENHAFLPPQRVWVPTIALPALQSTLSSLSKSLIFLLKLG